MKTIKIKFVDFWSSFQKENFYVYQYLAKKYNVVISDNPDYLFFSSFGYEHLNYDCVRIFYTGENVRPNFNQCDYAIGFDYIEFEDRYIRFPLYLAFDKYRDIFKLAEKKHLDKNNLKIRDKFCNMVCSNGLNSERIRFFKKLNTYKQVDSGGKLLNNVGGPVESKLEFQKNYKFSLAFENSKSNGYSTEKIVDAFASGGIPIYWGDPRITEIFNEKAFINGNQFNSDKELIAFIQKIEEDDHLYLSYIKEPMLLNANYLKETEKKLNEFLDNIFEQDINKAQRRSECQYAIQEKKYFLLSDRIVKFISPFLKLKAKIKNKLVR